MSLVDRSSVPNSPVVSEMNEIRDYSRNFSGLLDEYTPHTTSGDGFHGSEGPDSQTPRTPEISLSHFPESYRVLSRSPSPPYSPLMRMKEEEKQRLLRSYLDFLAGDSDATGERALSLSPSQRVQSWGSWDWENPGNPASPTLGELMRANPGLLSPTDSISPIDLSLSPWMRDILSPASGPLKDADVPFMRLDGRGNPGSVEGDASNISGGLVQYVAQRELEKDSYTALPPFEKPASPQNSPESSAKRNDGVPAREQTQRVAGKRKNQVESVAGPQLRAGSEYGQ